MNNKKAKEIRRLAKQINEVGLPIDEKLIVKNLKKKYKKMKKEGEL